MTEQTAAHPKRATRLKGSASTVEATAPAAPVRAAATATPRASATPRATAAPRAAPAKRPVAVPIVIDRAPVDESQLTIHQGGIGALSATDVAVSQGGVGALRAQRLSVELGGVGAAMTDQLDLRQGLAYAVIARDARFEQAGVRTLIANRVHFGPNSGAGVVLAAHVDGDVRTLVDWRGALAFGAAAGVVIGLLRGRRR
jgi:hypothetical protein